MHDSALTLSTFPWTWNLTWKTDSQTNLLQKNDLLNALLLNKKQTDESDQIFIPYNNMSSLSATLHSLICRQKKFPAEVFLSSWQGRYRCRLVCPLRALVSRFQRRFFLKKCVSRVQRKSVSQLALRACCNYHPLANGHTKRQRRQREKLPALHLGNTLCPVSSRLMAEITRNRNGHTRSVKCSHFGIFSILNRTYLVSQTIPYKVLSQRFLAKPNTA